MNKTLAILIAGLFAAAANAQTPTAEKAAVTNSKPQARAEAKVASKPAGQVKTGAGGDINKVPEGGAIGTDKAAVAGEKRAETRDTRRTNKDGSVKAKSMQGGTPK